MTTFILIFFSRRVITWLCVSLSHVHVDYSFIWTFLSFVRTWFAASKVCVDVLQSREGVPSSQWYPTASYTLSCFSYLVSFIQHPLSCLSFMLFSYLSSFYPTVHLMSFYPFILQYILFNPFGILHPASSILLIISVSSYLSCFLSYSVFYRLSILISCTCILLFMSLHPAELSDIYFAS